MGFIIHASRLREGVGRPQASAGPDDCGVREARINRVARFFGLLTDKADRRSVHRSAAELEAAITAYIEATNAQPERFRWTKSADDILASINRFCRRTLESTRPSALPQEGGMYEYTSPVRG